MLPAARAQARNPHGRTLPGRAPGDAVGTQSPPAVADGGPANGNKSNFPGVSFAAADMFYHDERHIVSGKRVISRRRSRGESLMSHLETRERFMELLTAHQSHLFGYIFALARDPQDAEDIFQETALVLWQKFSQFDGTNFAGWACRTAQYQAFNFLRAKRRGRTIFGEGLLASLTQVAEELGSAALAQRQALEACLERLPRGDYALVEQCYAGGSTLKTVAEQMNRSAQSVCNSLRRIRRMLFECIGRTLAEERAS